MMHLRRSRGSAIIQVRHQREVIQELCDNLGPEAYGLSDEVVVRKVMCKALDYHRQLSELKPKEPPRPEPPHRYGQR